MGVHSVNKVELFKFLYSGLIYIFCQVSASNNLFLYMLCISGGSTGHIFTIAVVSPLVENFLTTTVAVAVIGCLTTIFAVVANTNLKIQHIYIDL